MVNNRGHINILKSISLGNYEDISFIRDVKAYIFSMEYLSLEGGFNFFMEIAHQNYNFDELLLDIVKSDITTNDLLNNISVSIHTPINVLNYIVKNSSPSTSGHAQLSILRKKLDEGFGEKELLKVITKASDDYGVNIGIRCQIANHPKTPKNILLKLLKDDVDFISKAAKANINK